MKDRLLVEELYSLDEPWRTRFLLLVARQANCRPWIGEPPGRDKVEQWLEDSSNRRVIRELLRSWQNARGD